jgi:hypothetical protein
VWQWSWRTACTHCCARCAKAASHRSLSMILEHDACTYMQDTDRWCSVSPGRDDWYCATFACLVRKHLLLCSVAWACTALWAIAGKLPAVPNLVLTRGSLCPACARADVSAVPAQVSIGTDPYAVFNDADWALMIGAKPRGPGQERADLLDQNGRIFVDQVRPAVKKIAGYSNCKAAVTINHCHGRCCGISASWPQLLLGRQGWFCVGNLRCCAVERLCRRQEWVQ